MTTFTDMTKLSHDVLLTVFSHLNASDLGRATRVNRRWDGIINHANRILPGMKNIIAKDLLHSRECQKKKSIVDLLAWVKEKSPTVANVDLTKCYVDDEVMEIVSDMTTLTSLNLPHSTITDTGLERIPQLTQLASLDLTGCDEITDTGLVYVAGLTHLTSLNLSGCDKITDAGL